MRIPLLAGLVLLSSLAASFAQTVSPSTQAKIDGYGLTLRSPGTLNYSYDGSPVPLGDWFAGNFNLETNSEMAHERAVRDLNNSTYSATTINSIRSAFLSLAQNVDIRKMLIGYHDFVAPAASLVSSTATAKSGVNKIVLTGRYGQTIHAYCGTHPSREGLIVLAPGRASSDKSMFGLGATDYSNRMAEVYFDTLNVNVCVVRTYLLPDIALKRYGLRGRGVDITQIADLISWAESYLGTKAHPLIMGGVSNGATVAEGVALVDSRVDALLSIGASILYDHALAPGYPDISLTPSAIQSQDLAYATNDFLFRSNEVFKFWAPKPLIVSVGTHDAGETIGGGATDKFDHLHDLETLYASQSQPQCFEYNLFVGYHAADPVGEAARIQDLLDNCL